MIITIAMIIGIVTGYMIHPLMQLVKKILIVRGLKKAVAKIPGQANLVSMEGKTIDDVLKEYANTRKFKYGKQPITGVLFTCIRCKLSYEDHFIAMWEKDAGSIESYPVCISCLTTEEIKQYNKGIGKHLTG